MNLNAIRNIKIQNVKGKQERDLTLDKLANATYLIFGIAGGSRLSRYRLR